MVINNIMKFIFQGLKRRKKFQSEEAMPSELIFGTGWVKLYSWRQVWWDRRKNVQKIGRKKFYLIKWAEVYGGGVFESARVRRDRSNILNYISSKDWLFSSWECLLFVDLGVSLLIFKKTAIEDITAVLGGLTAEGSNTPRNHSDLIVPLNQSHLRPNFPQNTIPARSYLHNSPR